MMELTSNEIEFLSKSPDALRIVREYHDLRICEGEAMGFDCSFHHKRMDELKAESDRLEHLYD